jgi:hypothetical protein
MERVKTDTLTSFGGWLANSGNSWKMRAARWALPGALLLIVSATRLHRWLSPRIGRDNADLVLPSMLLLGFGLAIAVPLLLRSIRCRVCGLRMLSSQAARGLARPERERWIRGLNECPVCRDDGFATPGSRTRWLSSGRAPEPEYWSGWRLALAILAIAVAGIAIFLVGQWRVKP